MSEVAPPHLLLGADVGGTATRVAVATAGGEVLGVAAGPAGNPNSVGPEESARRVRAAAEQCLARVGEGAAERVVAAVIGLAGGARADDAYLTATRPAGLPVQPRLVSDLAVAFSSATPAPRGYVLVAGTGAVAGRIDAGELRERRDGWGWLLGDEGSGYWLGREAVRDTLTQLQSGTPSLGALAAAVVERLGTRDPVAVVQACYAQPPVWLSTFAELVARHADDPAAISIAHRAAGHLVHLLVDLAPAPDQPVVLAGSVATRPGPVREALWARLDAALDNPRLTAESGLVGALWLATGEAFAVDDTVHGRLARSIGRTSGTLV
ncbi:BadF/BadG/BcrA/BcrD ATPase family protein [Microlunatus aurantiacus]|uniref:BadF/BadG/BcrA/BcrD ATPase family protein n=1 Tax=Microlunatus aurantiacus TaxID=446786 RepID=A0ABP7E620_9ACTN